MNRIHHVTAAGVAFAATILATPSALAAQTPAQPASDLRTAPAVNAKAGTFLRYGGTASVGEGQVRAYVQVDQRTNEPIEIGVAFTERALDGLPKAGAGHAGGHEAMVHTYLLDLPVELTTPFRFVELNWNPMGHEPEGVYQDVPHFDFHFYTVSKAERDAIVPTNPDFAAKANNLPTGDYVPAATVQLGPPGATPAQVAVPQMGVHWVDVRSAELQKLLGKPEAYKPFTATFIHGSWDGRFHFWEPMVTRAHIVAKKAATDPAVRDEVIPISVPARYHVPGYYPTAYRITWDAEAKEYRVALTKLVKRS